MAFDGVTSRAQVKSNYLVEKQLNRAVFVDRDGVINGSILRNGRPYPPRDRNEFYILDGVEAATTSLRKAGFILVVVTNQPDLSRGLTTKSFIESVHSEITQRTGISHFYVCSHLDEDHCVCRKPKPGLILRAAHELQLELKSSFLVGDRWRDIEAGNSVGCKAFFIDNDYQEKRPEPPFYGVRSLLDASRLILEMM